MSVIKTFVKQLLGKGVSKSYSQFGEDLIIRPLVPRTGGFYVDVGCYHPMLYSNTYKLYSQGWKGIVIDPNIQFKKLFSIFRPRDTFVLSAVGTTTKRMYFAFADGAYNTFDATAAEEYKKKTTLVASYEVSIQPLKDILKDVHKIDLMSVDVEGLDLEVLQSHDWIVKPNVIIVEALPGSPVDIFLVQMNYKLVGLTHLNSVYQLISEA